MKTTCLLKSIIGSLVVGIVFSCSLRAQSDFGYVLSGNGNILNQINLNARAISATISTGGAGGVLNQRGTQLWVNAGTFFSIVNTRTKLTAYTSGSFGGSISNPVFSRDGSKAYILNYSYPTTLLVYDTANYAAYNSVSLIGTSAWRSSPVISKDGNRLYFIDNDSYLNEVNAATYAVRRVYLSSSSTNCIKLSPDDSLIFMWNGNQYSSAIQVYKRSSLTSVTTISAYNYVSNLDFARDSKTLFVGLASNTMLQKIDISALPATGSTYVSLPNYAFDVAVDPSDTLLYLTYSGVYSANNIGVYNLKADKMLGTLSVSYYPTYLIMPMRKDSIAPASVQDFSASALTHNAIRLTFTTPGDDGTAGQAAFYDVRYDTVRIADSTFAKAKKVPGIQAPHSAGTKDTIDITGLRASTTYYFAIKAGDEVLNLSPMATSSAATPAPPHIAYQLDPISRIVTDNDSVTVPLKIQNTGDEDLSYRVSLVNIGKAEDLVSIRAMGKLSGLQKGKTPAAVNETKSVSSGVSVLMVCATYSGFENDVKQKLLAQTGFSTIDIFYASSSTPTLDVLKQYDVVFVWSDNSFYNSTAMGDVLADYIDGGGNVVTALFSISPSSSGTLRGRFNTDNYWAIAPGTTTSGSRATLGAVGKPNHPIMKGVKTFDGGYSSGYGSYRLNGGTISSGATLVASWSDGSPLVAVKKIKQTNRVDLGFFPPSSDAYPAFWVSSTDGAKIMANALRYAAFSYGMSTEGEAVVSCTPDSGVIKRGETQAIAVTLKTKNCLPGDYAMIIGLDSNDPDSSYAEVRVNFSVHDITPPAMGIRFFQNEAFPQNLTIVSVAHEKLFSPAVTAGVDGDSVQQPMALIDTSNFVYSTDYKLTKSGMLSVRYAASDSLGNRSITTRQLAVQRVSSNAAAKIVSADQQASMRLSANTVSDPVFVTAAVDDGSSEEPMSGTVGPVYRFSPQSVTLSAPAEITIGFAEPGATGSNSHYGIFSKNAAGEWVYVPTRIDLNRKTVSAQVHALGEFRIINDPSIRPEEYVEAVPVVFALEQNYPNPFNPSTTIRYQLPAAGHVRLTVYDAIGREVAALVNEAQQAGFYSVEFNGANLSSGIYFARLQSGENMQLKKLVLMK